MTFKCFINVNLFIQLIEFHCEFVAIKFETMKWKITNHFKEVPFMIAEVVSSLFS